jgi:hypothetical protein
MVMSQVNNLQPDVLCAILCQELLSVARRVIDCNQESFRTGNMAGFSTEHLQELMRDKLFLCKCIMTVVWDIANMFILICDKMCFMRHTTNDDMCITLNIGYDSTSDMQLQLDLQFATFDHKFLVLLLFSVKEHNCNCSFLLL